jgi:hypothetical protein
MRLSTVLASVNNNREYYMFIPTQILFWGKFGIKFIAIFVGESIPIELIDYKENIILWSKNLDIHTSYVGQNLRMYYPAILNLPDDECIMITDMDMLPCSPGYYKDGLEDFSKEDFICYGEIHHHCQHIHMCYNSAHPSVWSKCFGINNIDDIERRIYDGYNNNYSGIPGSNEWFIDQVIMYNSLVNYPYLKVLNKTIRRLETDIYKEYLNKGEQQFFANYDDVHFHRSYFSNKELIENAKKQLSIII